MSNTTIEQIAWHKAGIIKPGATALSAVTRLTHIMRATGALEPGPEPPPSRVSR